MIFQKKYVSFLVTIFIILLTVQLLYKNLLCTCGCINQSLGRKTTYNASFPRLVDIYDFKIGINDDICGGDDIAVFTFIHSAIENREARDIIRQTWGSVQIDGVNIRVAFILGQSENTDLQFDIIDEANLNRDILQGGFIDTYHNLSYKHAFALRWITEYCPQAEIVVKTDDDIYVDLYAIYHISRDLKGLSQYKEGQFIYCPVITDDEVKRDPENKWYTDYDQITEEMAPEGKNPPYCYGFIYLTNPATIFRLEAGTRKHKFVWIDDLWITGYIAKWLSIEHTNVNSFYHNNRDQALLWKIMSCTVHFHEDYYATKAGRELQHNMLLDRYARLNYQNKEKCYNSIYKDKDREVSDEDWKELEILWNVMDSL